MDVIVLGRERFAAFLTLIGPVHSVSVGFTEVGPGMPGRSDSFREFD
jgi:hypothetical protein